MTDDERILSADELLHAIRFGGVRAVMNHIDAITEQLAEKDAEIEQMSDQTAILGERIAKLSALVERLGVVHGARIGND